MGLSLAMTASNMICVCLRSSVAKRFFKDFPTKKEGVHVKTPKGGEKQKIWRSISLS